MNIKNIMVGGISALTLTLAMNPAYAMDFSSTFTGDNSVNSFSYNDGSLTTLDTTSLAGSQDWTQNSSLNLTLNQVSNYEFIWEVANEGGPAAFLADFTLGSDNYATSTDATIWSYSADGSSWSAVTGYGSNGTSPWGPRSGISSDATWIWDSSPQNGETVYLKASVSAVPEPSTYALFLAGLGLVGFMARRRASNKA